MQPERSPKRDPDRLSPRIDPETAAIQPKNRKLNPVRALVAAGIVAAAAILGFRNGGSGAVTDSVAPETAEALWNQLSSVVLEPDAVDAADPQAVEEAVSSMELAPEQAAELSRDVQSRKVKVGFITLRDNMAEDGDFVRIESAGYSRVVPIMHQTAKFAIPYYDQTIVTITGVKDGGGGITLAIESNGSAIPLPPLNPGQAITIPLR